MSFVDHDRCRHCGAPDGPGHTATECERVRAQRADRRVYPTALRCGAGAVCAWMLAAVDVRTAGGVVFARREMEHPDTFQRVTRYVASVNGERVVKIAACPACGGNPNEENVPR